MLLAVPGTAEEVALSSVVGLEGKTVLDATNLYGACDPVRTKPNALSGSSVSTPVTTRSDWAT
ncbi:hypothetical protein [Streptomyces sp. NPDC094472]|uniref:hypothetical protein n=1 Tax=Streptomyces sp. NPDC094472 TaxID=3155080 RepID=UPI00331777DD